MAVVVGLDGQPKTISGEFSITDVDRASVTSLVKQLDEAIGQANPQERNALLAAMTELIARYLDEGTTPSDVGASKETEKVAS